MHKILLVAALTSLTLSPAISHAAEAGATCEKVQPKIESIRANLHSNYMPNFIPVVMMNQEALSLTAEQCTKLTAFRDDKAAKGKMVIEKIIKLEAAAHDAALAGEDLAAMKVRHAEIAELRAKIMEGKMACHQFMKKLLTEEQYTKLIKEVYPAMRTKMQERIADK
ncbi:hypothetical protein [Thiomicrorhabdus aquaedulcis]|uniref:hypothetical protein n=1 Tax=Thiomicrorhabdus aquaedulcis TaxID=2211106 RepID=UPI000FDA8A54|nr:hypothetical protein [Thiomicrorhabdus aquaedulcis]